MVDTKESHAEGIVLNYRSFSLALYCIFTFSLDEIRLPYCFIDSYFHTGSFVYSSPSHRYYYTQVHLHTGTLYSGTPSHRYLYSQVHLHTGTFLLRYTFTQVPLFSGTPSHRYLFLRYTFTQVPLYSNTLTLKYVA